MFNFIDILPELFGAICEYINEIDFIKLVSICQIFSKYTKFKKLNTERNALVIASLKHKYTYTHMRYDSKEFYPIIFNDLNTITHLVFTKLNDAIDNLPESITHLKFMRFCNANKKLPKSVTCLALCGLSGMRRTEVSMVSDALFALNDLPKLDCMSTQTDLINIPTAINHIHYLFIPDVLPSNLCCIYINKYTFAFEHYNGFMQKLKDNNFVENNKYCDEWAQLFLKKDHKFCNKCWDTMIFL